jgi:ribonuclease HII
MARQRSLFAAAALDLRAFEKRAQRRGFHCVAGLDEVGRGPLAGPVTAAAVILPLDVSLPQVRDSKQLTASLRETLCREIIRCADDFSIASVDAAEVDMLNILQATFEAMLRALQGLRSTPDFLLIDGPYRLPINVPQQGITHGDQRSLSIAAASILAKVHRDRFMCHQDRLYPVYGFLRNKGYGTREHLEALRRHGPCPIHRRTFRGVCSEEL